MLRERGNQRQEDRPVFGRPKLHAKRHPCVTADVASAAFVHHTQWHAAGVYMHGSGEGVIVFVLLSGARAEDSLCTKSSDPRIQKK